TATLNSFAQAILLPQPPEYFKEKFMKCLYDNHFENALCRNESKEYLECRMERKLMLQEPLEKLGFGDLIGGKSEAKK
uniref:CHCH domain-containing protein n=1 Tax=Rhinopithecus bieti TaxID=61621 RepID=A0A2K6KP44_RHIBE